jgi:hypothetical protein
MADDYIELWSERKGQANRYSYYIYRNFCEVLPMLKRMLFLVFGTTIVQVVIYTILLQSGLFIEKHVDIPKHGVVDWGLTIPYSVLLFSEIVFFLNLLTTVINRKWFNYAAIILAITFYVIGWGEDFDTHPYRTSFLILAGITSIMTKLPVDGYFRTKYKKNTTSKDKQLF